MAKKKKGKKKGKKGKKTVSSLTNLEKETLKLKIEYLQSKIKWRTELNESLKEDTQAYKEAFAKEHNEESEIVTRLEEAIINQNQNLENINAAVPEAQSCKHRTKNIQLEKLSKSLLEAKINNTSNKDELFAIQKKLERLEDYDVSEMENKILKVENQLNDQSNEESFNDLKIILRQEECLRAEMEEMFKKESFDFQEKLNSRISNNAILRIAEETRWREYSGKIFNQMKDHLTRENDKKKNTLEMNQGILNLKRDGAVEESYALQELKMKISALEEYNRNQKEMKRKQLKFKKEQQHKKYKMLKLNQKFQDMKQTIRESLIKMEHNVKDIKDLEDQFVKETEFGKHLIDFLKRSQSIMEKEIKYSLSKTLHDFPKSQNTLEELQTVFTDAASFIFRSRNGVQENF